MMSRLGRIDPFTATVLLLLAILVVGFAVGRNDAALYDEEYCRMVSEKRWPDYRGTFQQECQPTKTPSKPR